MEIPATTLNEYAKKSYRYLRLSIVIMVASLIVSVIIERLNASCWQGSFSAYYYTPAHAVFVGSLVATGACLIAIKAADDWEDMLLNVAGMLAPVVAFVPTKPPSTVCSRAPLDLPDRAPYVSNNILSLAIGGAIAIAVAYGLARVKRKDLGLETDKLPVRVGILGAAAITLAGVAWFIRDEGGFLAHAHDYSAIAMFVFIGLVVLFNGFRARPKYQPAYRVIVAAMVIAAIAVIVAKLVFDDWAYEVLVIEALEAGLFGVFWLLQTLENWEAGIEQGTRSTRLA